MSRTRRILAALPGALRRALPRLRGLAPSDLSLLLLAPFALPAVALALHHYGLRRVHDRLVGPPSTTPEFSDDSDQHRRAEQISWCVQVAAAYGPWPANCLQRSVVLCWFLHKRGLRGDLRIGVQQTPEGGVAFHAWVERDGVVINDRRDVRERYAVFDGFDAPSSVRFS